MQLSSENANTIMLGLCRLRMIQKCSKENMKKCEGK